MENDLCRGFGNWLLIAAAGLTSLFAEAEVADKAGRRVRSEEVPLGEAHCESTNACGNGAYGCGEVSRDHSSRRKVAKG